MRLSLRIDRTVLGNQFILELCILVDRLDLCREFGSIVYRNLHSAHDVSRYIHSYLLAFTRSLQN